METHLAYLRELTITHCRLVHEKVSLCPETHRPLTQAHSGEYVRPSICSRSVRNHLGCAHTTSRQQLITRVTEFAERVPASKQAACSLITGLTRLEAAIIDTDRQKSEQELLIAKSIDALAEGQIDAQHLRDRQAALQPILQRHQQNNMALKQLVDSYIGAIAPQGKDQSPS